MSHPVADADVREQERVAAVRRLHLLDTQPEERFAAIVRLCQMVFDVPMAAVNLIDAERQYAVAQLGLHDGDTPRLESMCHFTVAGDAELIVPDMTADERFHEHASVTSEKNVRFYAGIPLRSEGLPVGSLCLVDDRPRTLDAAQLAMLRHLADLVQRELTGEEDLFRAAELQRRLLPRRVAVVPGLDVAGRCVMSREVGGDFYDWQVVDGQLQVVVADVMGKGLSAALIASSVRAVARGTSLYNPLGAAVGRIAGSLDGDLAEAGSFVTLFAARIQPETGAVTWADAGHGLAALVAGDTVTWLAGDDLPIGVATPDEWAVHGAQLTPDDGLVVFSDGVLDAYDDRARLDEAILRVWREADDAAGFVDRLAADVRAADTTDDITVLAVRRETR